jgi:serine/threonine protein kinase
MHRRSIPMNELELFAAAIAIVDEGERASLLHRECAGRPEVRQRIEQLLNAHVCSHPLLDQPDLEQTGAYFPSERPGAVIAGRYKLLEQIGEGGMGRVWVAEQMEPVRRKVALKLIKAGMDSKSVIARFEAERQALAVMDHPNVAKVLDGGLTETARPFFVMEYVKGVPITEYCDATRLSVPDRLKLFTQVCQAVQHAHQKGIIHRDLKPSNILVAPYDDKPVPKIIDFGLAKAMHQPLTERTLHTAHETVLGTPLYMSPEQAQLNNLDVDTRSDLYSLGVVLYELLTGTTPLEKQQLREAAWDEIRRIIREEEPPRPSTRLSSTETLASVAAYRQSDPQKLTKQMRGELDWVVMKALEKDRSRRYETANSFADDIRRYLVGEAVLAHPPSLPYKLKKLLRRHKGVSLATAAVAAVMIVATAVSAWLAREAQRSERDAIAARNQAVARGAEALAAQRLADARTAQLLTAYGQAINGLAEQLMRGRATPQGCQNLERLLTSYQNVAQEIGPSRESDRIHMKLRRTLCDAYSDVGDPENCRRHWREMSRLAQTLVASDPNDERALEDQILCYDRLGNLYAAEKNASLARETYLKQLELTKTLAARHSDDWHVQLDLSDVHRNLGELELLIAGDAAAAIPWLQKAIDLLRPLERDGRLATVPTWVDRLHNLERFLRQAQEQQRQADRDASEANPATKHNSDA